MKASLPQQAAHRPAPSTGSRHAAQSCGSATSATRPRPARTAAATRARRPAASAVAVSPCMRQRYRPAGASSTARASADSGLGDALMRASGSGHGCGMRRAWLNCHQCRHEMDAMSSPHPLIFDRGLLAARRRRAAALGPAAFLLERVATELAERLGAVLRRFERAVDLGTPTGAVRRALALSGNVGTIIAAGAPGLDAISEAGLAIVADEEALPFCDASLDLVTSALALHFVNDLPGTLVQIRRALRPDGLMLAALAGGDTLTELRQAFAAAEAEIENGVSPHVI